MGRIGHVRRSAKLQTALYVYVYSVPTYSSVAGLTAGSLVDYSGMVLLVVKSVVG